jgi:archaemetzincin
MRPTNENAPEIRRLTRLIEKLKPLHEKLGPPQPGDWLDVHDEPGQTFREYLDSKPVTAHGKRKVIYVQPMGAFAKSQQAIVDATAEFLRAYFQLPVKVNKPWPESKVPAHARRRHPHWGDEQILTTYVLHELLRPNLPDDAASYLALTATDLWPGEGWNFVFGQASIRDHVGVWSIYRKGEPDGGEDAFRLCLLRTIKTASHEVGHMFSMHHCTAYQCNMCGSNSVEESDRRPLPLCPECLAKLLYATGAEPLERFRRLVSFCKEHGLTDERHLYEQSMEAITGR